MNTKKSSQTNNPWRFLIVSELLGYRF